MSENILLRFLQNGLIDVGGDDVKLKKLQDTANILSAVLQENPAKTTAFALTACDPDITAEQPVVEEVTAALAEQWPTYVNTFAGTPTTVIRAVLLAALVRAADKNNHIAAALVTYARNMLPHIRVGNEQPIWHDLVMDLENEVEKRAETEWATPAAIKVPPLKLSVDSLKIPVKTLKLNRKELTQNLFEASGPHNPDEEAGKNPNPHWPNSDSSWSHGFAPRAARAIADAVDPALKVTIGPVDFGEITETVSRHFNKTLEAVSRANAGLQRRTYLLWWKEALYSPSRRRRYRDLPGLQAAVLMAFDLYTLVSNFTPWSVSSFLDETVRALPQIDVEERKPLLELIKEVAASEELTALRVTIESLGLGAARVPLLAVVGNREAATMTSRRFKALTGVPADTELSLPDLTVWLFRELQATRALIHDRPTRRRTRKAQR